MDYDFFVRRVAVLDPEAVTNALTWALATTPQSHDGFRNQQVRQIKPVPGYVMNPILQGLQHLLPASAVTGAEIVVLAPGESVGEHSDLQGVKPNHMWNAAFHHKIQVPLQTDALCTAWHRRTKLARREPSVLECGYAWAYNDYVWHGGINKGQVTRYQLSISYLDPELEWVPRLKEVPRR